VLRLSGRLGADPADALPAVGDLVEVWRLPGQPAQLDEPLKRRVAACDPGAAPDHGPRWLGPGTVTTDDGQTVPMRDVRVIERAPGVDYRAGGEPERCDECGNRIPTSQPSEVNDEHAESCSLHSSAILPDSPAVAAFKALTQQQRNRLLDEVFSILEYDQDGQPGGKWSSDTTQSLGDLFTGYGVTFTTPESVG
jgi:hypothetical protein